MTDVIEEPRAVDRSDAVTPPSTGATEAQSTVDRRVRSFVLRQGRISAAQQRACDELLPRYTLDISRTFDGFKVFGRRAPVRSVYAPIVSAFQA